MKEIFNKLKENKKILIPITSILLLMILLAGVSFALFNYSNNTGNNGINSGHISMTYTESSNEYIVENALPMKEQEGVNSTNYFEFSVTTKSPTNANDDEGVSIPYEITITESEGNTLTNDKIKMYVTEVEGEKEIDHTIPTFVSYFEPSLYKDGQIKVGFNLHLHRNGNETVTTKYRLRAWIDEDVDVSNWNTLGEFVYKFKVNVNGEAKYQGYHTDQSCFTYELNDNNNYSITGYDYGKCGGKNIVIPKNILETKVLPATLENINWVSDEEFVEIYKDMMISQGVCDSYGTIETDDDWQGCLAANNVTQEEFEQFALSDYSELKTNFEPYIGYPKTAYGSELLENLNNIEEMGVGTLEWSEEKEIKVTTKIDTIKSFVNTQVAAVSNDENINVIDNLNNITNKRGYNNIVMVSDTYDKINNIIVPENIIIETDAFSTYEINNLIDRKGDFPSGCFEYTPYNSDIAITSYKCLGVNSLVLPSTIENIPVVGIYPETFKDKRLKKISISNNLIGIASYAFSDNELTNVIIPDNIKSISTYAFLNNNIAKLYLPEGIQAIGDSAFKNNQILSVDIPDSVSYVGEYSFQNNKIANLKLGNQITFMGKFAFADNELTILEIPEGISGIRRSVFENNKLKYVTVPDTVDLSSGIFYKNKIEKIVNSDGYTSGACFTLKEENETLSITNFHCNGLQQLDIPPTVNNKEITKIDDHALGGYQVSYGFVKINIPDTIVSIGKYAFQKNKIKEIVIPKNVTEIGQYAFLENTNLRKIVNKTNLAFDWNNIINGTSSDSFIAGTVTNQYGNIEIISE